MMIASVGVPSGVNAQRVTAFVGAKLHEMTGYGFDPALQNHFMDEMKQLTSPFPIVEAPNSRISQAAQVDPSQPFIPAGPNVQNSGKGQGLA